MLEMPEKPRLRLLLDHFALIEDDREAWRVAQRRFYVTSRILTAEQAAHAIRAHWAIETSLPKRDRVVVCAPYMGCGDVLCIRAAR